MDNLSIPFATKQADTATPINQFAQQQLNNEQQTQTILKQHYDNMDAREKSRLTSTLAGAVQLKSFLDNDDLDGAQNFLVQRKKALFGRMATGENIDTQETDYALEAIRSGNVDQLKNEIGGLMAAGQVYGILDTQSTVGGATGALADRLVKEGSAKNISEALQMINGGAGQLGRNNANIQTGQAANYATQTGKNVSDFQYAAPTAFQKEQGQGAGKQFIANQQKLADLGTLENSVTAAEQSLQKVSMTGPIFGRVGAATNDPNYINLQRDLNEITLLAKELYNLGSGQGFTDSDRNFLQELAGGKYNRDDSIAYALKRFKDTIKTRNASINAQNQQYQQQYGGQQPQGMSQGATPPQQGQFVRVRNPQTGEVLEIDASDLQAAQAEGFVQQ